MRKSSLTICPRVGLGDIGLGLRRDSVIRWMNEAGIDYVLTEGDVVKLVDPIVELLFDPVEKLLKKIRVFDDTVFGEQGPVIGQILPAALSALGATREHEAWWRLEVDSPIGEPIIDTENECPLNPPAELLLSCGTLWLPESDIGLVMLDGLVSEVVMQSAANMPRPGIATLTARHREIAKHGELQDRLRRWARRRASIVGRIATWLFAAVHFGR